MDEFYLPASVVLQQGKVLRKKYAQNLTYLQILKLSFILFYSVVQRSSLLQSIASQLTRQRK